MPSLAVRSCEISSKKKVPPYVLNGLFAAGRADANISSRAFENVALGCTKTCRQRAGSSPSLRDSGGRGQKSQGTGGSRPVRERVRGASGRQLRVHTPALRAARFYSPAWLPMALEKGLPRFLSRPCAVSLAMNTTMRHENDSSRIRPVEQVGLQSTCSRGSHQRN